MKKLKSFTFVNSIVAVLLVATMLLVAVSAKLLAADTTITVGATPVPHAEILQYIKPLLAKKGYKLVVKDFNDYVLPNLAVEDGDLDANFFQHLPYLDEFNKTKGTHLVSVAGIHIEPMGLYSKTIKKLSDFKKGDSIAVPNDPTNESRALELLQNNGLVRLDNSVKLKTKIDVRSNPKRIKFKELDAPQLPRALSEVTAAVINTNYALAANLNPMRDAIVIEGKKSPFVNILVVKKGNEKKAKIRALVEVLRSSAVKNFILKKYKGSIVPAF